MFKNVYLNKFYDLNLCFIWINLNSLTSNYNYCCYNCFHQLSNLRKVLATPMFMLDKIVTEAQAEEFVGFVTKKFKSVENLKDWLNPISDELGIIAQAKFTMFFHENDTIQRKQRDFLMLNFGENKNIIFVGSVYENWRDNSVFGTVDFSEEQNYAKTFFDLQSKNEQYMEHLKQTEKMYNEIHSIAQCM